MIFEGEIGEFVEKLMSDARSREELDSFLESVTSKAGYELVITDEVSYKGRHVYYTEQHEQKIISYLKEGFVMLLWHPVHSILKVAQCNYRYEFDKENIAMIKGDYYLSGTTDYFNYKTPTYDGYRSALCQNSGGLPESMKYREHYNEYVLCGSGHAPLGGRQDRMYPGGEFLKQWMQHHFIQTTHFLEHSKREDEGTDRDYLKDGYDFTKTAEYARINRLPDYIKKAICFDEMKWF